MFTPNFFVLEQNTNIILYVARGIVMYFLSGLQDQGWILSLTKEGANGGLRI
jgi:hypothetical protein